MHRPSPCSLFTPYPRSCHPIAFPIFSHTFPSKNPKSQYECPPLSSGPVLQYLHQITFPRLPSLSLTKNPAFRISPRINSLDVKTRVPQISAWTPQFVQYSSEKRNEKKNNLQNNLIPAHDAYCFRPPPPVKTRTERRADAFPNPLLRKKHKTTQDPVMEDPFYSNHIHNPIPANPNPSPPSSLKIPRGATAVNPHPWTPRA